MKDKLLTLIVMVGAIVAYWVVMFQQHRKKPRPGSRHYDSAGGVMPAATAVAMARSPGTAIPGITAVAIPAGAMAAVMEVVTAGAEVTAAGVVGIETQTLAPVDLFRRRFFRFIPV